MARRNDQQPKVCATFATNTFPISSHSSPQMLREHLTFFRQFRQRFETTGAIAPSSRFLARAITRYLRQRTTDQPVRVLEIGPGTGAFTNSIVKHLQVGDRFDLVELNESFADHLRSRFETEPGWNRVAAFSEVHVQPLQEFQQLVMGSPPDLPTDLEPVQLLWHTECPGLRCQPCK